MAGPNQAEPDGGALVVPREDAIRQTLETFFDEAFYLERYPDIGAAGIDPILHFIRFGLEEKRDPNLYFDGAWYTAHYPDVGASGMNPLLHYLLAGAGERRNPSQRFDATWYVEEHPESAANPLHFHMRIGRAQGYLTEKPIDIADYLPSRRPPLPQPHRVFVDVVIPVYRGLEETRCCIESVIADQQRPIGRIIVIDDCSPEQELTNWLQSLAADGQIFLVKNPRNVGFVASVNRGMEEAGDHDVVLLNSDTEVPEGWLVRLMAQAYAHPRIATVSPFSNNATICGYPDNNGSPLLFGQTVGEMDVICQTVNTGRFVDVPTTVGFCMYIRRQALNEVGLFDTERFTLGYGEENDFCLRATAFGWRHRLACDAFVYHKGSVSFRDQTNVRIERATKLLLERFPDYNKLVARHVILDEVAPFRFAVTASLFKRSGLPVILFVSHDLGGGIRRHMDILVRRLQGKAHFLLLAGTDRGDALSVPLLPDHPVLTLSAHRFDDLLVLLQSFNVSRLHIHHLLGIDIDVPRLARELGVRFDVTVHDFYAVCPQINLLPWRHSLYCNEPDIGDCNTCIANRDTSGARDIVSWRAERAWQFTDADRVICPSADALARLQRFGVADRAILAPHEPVAAAAWPLRLRSTAKGKLRVAVIGTLVDHKGARTVARVAEAMDPQTTEIHLIGHTDGPFPAAAAKRMKITGRYDEADLPALIEKVAPHIIWFPIAWPETFSYTLSAAIVAGTAIAATDIGSFSERLAGRPFTWLADVATSTQSWLGLFEEIRALLRKPPKSIVCSNRDSVEDFYASAYLQPTKSRPKPGRNASARPRIMVVPEVFEPWHPTPCAYIRLLQPLHHPAIVADAQVRVTDARNALAYHADLIVTQRHAIPDVETADALAAHARRTGAALVFDLDDDLLNIPVTHPDARTLRPRAGVVRRMLELADMIWVSTSSLAETLSPFRHDAIIIENRLDERIWTPSEPTGPIYGEPVRILAMGTSSHNDDFAMIEPVLQRLKQEHDDMVVIDILGMTNQPTLPDGFNRIGPSPHGRRSYPAFVDWLCSQQPGWHIGLAPLLDTEFNRGKSSLKAMDYAALGMTVLASDTPTYRGSLADGPAGQLVANTTENWYNALTRLVRDQEMRRHRIAQARGAFLAAGTLVDQAALRRDALTRALGRVRQTETAA